MVHFYGKGKYYPPRFIWNQTVGPTALKFMSSQKLGKDYENDLFVADFHKGNIYHFKLNADRTNLILEPPLNDKIANSEKELSNITFATGFGAITDLQISPSRLPLCIDIYWRNISNNKSGLRHLTVNKRIQSEPD